MSDPQAPDPVAGRGHQLPGFPVLFRLTWDTEKPPTEAKQPVLVRGPEPGRTARAEGRPGSDDHQGSRLRHGKGSYTCFGSQPIIQPNP